MGLSFRHVVCFSATMAIGSFFYMLTLAPMDTERHPRAAALDRTPTREGMVRRIREAMAQGQMTAADRWADTLIEHHSEDPAAFFYRALLDRELGREESAAMNWRMLDSQLEALTGRPQRELAYFRAWAKLGMGETDEARAMFTRMADDLAEAAGGEDGEISGGLVHFNLACYRALAGDADRAMSHWEQAVAHGYGRGFDADRGWWMVDPDLEPLRGDDRFWVIGSVMLHGHNERFQERPGSGDALPEQAAAVEAESGPEPPTPPGG